MESAVEHMDLLYEREINATDGGDEIGSTLTVFGVLIGVYVMVLVMLSKSQPELISFLVTDPKVKLAVAQWQVSFPGRDILSN